MRSLSAALAELIVLAEEAITRPNMVDPRFAQRLAVVAADIRHADARPAEGTRCTSAAMAMLIAIEGALARANTPHWLAIAGVTLPLLRIETFQQLTNEREARG